jgi:hypothetical protein
MQRLRWIMLPIGLVTAGVGAVAAQIRPVPAVLITTVEAIGRPANIDPLRMVERLMSFDADLDDRLDKDELPERMQPLMERADRDRDGFLSKDEIRQAEKTAPPSRGVVRSRTGADAGLSGVMSDLKLSREKHERALGIVRAHHMARGSHNTSNSELYARMRSLLDDEEYENFVAAAERTVRVVMIHELRAAPPPPPPPPPR